jgi:hypothetical protein
VAQAVPRFIDALAVIRKFDQQLLMLWFGPKVMRMQHIADIGTKFAGNIVTIVAAPHIAVECPGIND